jgi:biotin carboxyl carrier protein
MKLIVETDDRSEEIELSGDGSTMNVIIGDTSFDLDISEPEPNVHLVKKNGRIFEAFASHSAITGETLVSVSNEVFRVKVNDRRQLRSSANDAAGGDGPVEIRASMPGKIVRVLTEVGAEIERGQGVIVVEAMKMQNELKSPKQGVIEEIFAAEGMTVSAGDVLVTIE